MDKSIDAKEVAEKLETISKTNEQRSHVAWVVVKHPYDKMKKTI